MAEDRRVMVMADFPIGCRINFQGSVATVLYVGQLAEQKGLWVGVDWDDKFRGKHDGSFRGRRYFHTHYDTSGSFLRLDSLSAEVKGKTLVHAFEERYGVKIRHVDSGENVATDGSIHSQNQKEYTADLKVGSKKKILFTLQDFWMDGLLDRLTNVSFSEYDFGVIDPDEMEFLRNNLIFSRIHDLSLRRSLLHTLQEVYAVMLCFPNVITLSLADNRWTDLTLRNEQNDAFAQVRNVDVSRCQLNWVKEVCPIADHFLNLRSFSIAESNLSLIPSLPHTLENIVTDIDLSGNDFKTWESVSILAKCTALKSLNLECCQLVDIDIERADHFPNLEQLHLNRNAIASWASLKSLAKLSSLVYLTVLSNFFYDGEGPENETEADPNLPKCSSHPSGRRKITPEFEIRTARQFVIAILPRLRILNKTEVDRAERRGAELDYMKHYSADFERAVTDKKKPEFLDEHPSWGHLVKIYGEPEQAQPLDAGVSHHMATNVININLFIYDRSKLKLITAIKKFKNITLGTVDDEPLSGSDCEEHTTHKKIGIPNTLSVQRCRPLCRRLLTGINAMIIGFTYAHHSHLHDSDITMLSNVIPCENEAAEISSYGVVNNDVFFVAYTPLKHQPHE